MSEEAIPLTIVTSSAGYGRYLEEWAQSIIAQTVQPAAVRIFTHGDAIEFQQGQHAVHMLRSAGLDAIHEHEVVRLDFGVARNRAVAMSSTTWVQHLDADDTLMAHALEDVRALMDTADVISFGYERSGDLASGPRNKIRLYIDGTGLEMLDHSAPCSGVSPFRRSLWEQSPYRTDMRGAWDTALWIGFARLGARFRATRRPCFWYRQHGDSIFNRRRQTFDWTRAITENQLRGLRADWTGVAVVVPRDETPDAHRAAAWRYVREHYLTAHPDWQIVEGRSPADPWCKGAAVADALGRCGASTLVIADADCLISPDALREAVTAVRDGSAPWSVPHGDVHRLTEAATERFMNSHEKEELPLTRPAYPGFAGGGVFVVPRAAYEASGGIPRAFLGWGCEDEAVAVILDCLIGPHARGTTPLTHLWHPPQPTKADATVKTTNRAKLRAVQAAARTGESTLWQVLTRLGAVRSKARHLRTREEIAERRRSQSFLERRKRKAV